VESNRDLARCDGDIAGHVDDVAEDLSGLSVVVSAHAPCHQAVEAAGEHEERHVESTLSPTEDDRASMCWQAKCPKTL